MGLEAAFSGGLTWARVGMALVAHMVRGREVCSMQESA
jgi:hypothetical protein